MAAPPVVNPTFLNLPDPVVEGIPVLGPYLVNGPKIVGGAKNTIKGAKAASKGVANVTSVLTDGNTWVRIGEGLVGLILVGIGISAMLKGTPVGQASSSAAGLAFAPLKAKQVAGMAAKRAGAVESARLSARAAAKGAS